MKWLRQLFCYPLSQFFETRLDSPSLVCYVFVSCSKIVFPDDGRYAGFLLQIGSDVLGLVFAGDAKTAIGDGAAHSSVTLRFWLQHAAGAGGSAAAKPHELNSGAGTMGTWIPNVAFR
jgi:hypothetical protein